MPDEVTADPDSQVESDAATGESTDSEGSAGGPAVSEAQTNDSPVESSAEAATSVAPIIDSPPASAQPLKPAESEPRLRLHQLANELIRNRNRRLLVEFLQLRRALQ